eukprot:NODE_5913_length_669_cov_52.684502_g5890_i0.p2 GENE.NODE_5913_length_669_cov_52.684502_g5890_i0~~NODE_5913_length_669_cov_52.684502_g5890_i0.p2  ORF type:complete len:133 (-),score=18.69 NODE_5913_length_669_cov_52.684502_g5890_i0:57-455(-)
MFSRDCKRAQLLSTYYRNATDVSSMREIMSSNKYRTNPVSEHNPYFAISSRGDLATEHSGQYKLQCFGGMDCKVTSAATIGTLWIRSGPTTSDDLPPFDWDTANCTAPHTGLPTKYDFDWQQVPTGIQQRNI